MIAYQIRTSVPGDSARVTLRALKHGDETKAVAEYDQVCRRLAKDAETWLVELQAVMTTTMSKKTV
jgi:hypothetical protein